MPILDFKSYMLASDDPDNKGYISCSSLRRTEDWWRLYEAANEMAEKYGLDGSGIPLGAKVLYADKSNVYINLNRGYKGISGGGIGAFCGPVEDERWKDHYFCVKDGRFETPKWIYRPCWWRFLIVLPTGIDE